MGKPVVYIMRHVLLFFLPFLLLNLKRFPHGGFVTFRLVSMFLNLSSLFAFSSQRGDGSPSRSRVSGRTCAGNFGSGQVKCHGRWGKFRRDPEMLV